MPRGLPRGAGRRGFQGGATPLVEGRSFMPRPRRGGREANDIGRTSEGVFPSELTLASLWVYILEQKKG